MHAGLIEFGTSNTIDRALEDVSWKPLFAEKKTEEVVKTAPKSKKLKSEIAAEKSQQNLQKTLVGNTKAVMDPFLAKPGPPMPKPSFGIVKRKREDQPNKELETPSTKALPPEEAAAGDIPTKKPALISAIVE